MLTNAERARNLEAAIADELAIMRALEETLMRPELAAYERKACWRQLQTARNLVRYYFRDLTAMYDLLPREAPEKLL